MVEHMMLCLLSERVTLIGIFSQVGVGSFSISLTNIERLCRCQDEQEILHARKISFQSGLGVKDLSTASL